MMRPLPATTALLTVCGPDARPGVLAWLRWGFDATEPGGRWHDPRTGVIALVRCRRAYGTGLVALHPVGGPEHTDATLAAVRSVQDTSGAEFVTVERGGPAAALTAELSDRWPVAEWDWMWTTSVPPQVPGEDRVVRLGPADHPELTDLLSAWSPRHSAEPGEPAVRQWLGIRDGDGSLLACGASYAAVTDVPLLASIAVAGPARGRGLAAAVTARLTRDELSAGAEAVTLDHYVDDPAVKRLYSRLGYRTALRFASCRLPTSGRSQLDAYSPPGGRRTATCALPQQ